MSSYVFHWGTVWRAMPELIAGALVTLEITLLSMTIGLACAIPLAIGRSHRGAAARVSGVWIQLARNTPCLFQIYMVYFGLGATGINLDSYATTLSAIAFNNAGYLAENVRGGMNAVAPQQRAAARSLGMTSAQVYAHIVLPQALRAAWFPMVNTMMWAMLNSSLGMIVGLQELSGAAAFQSSTSFRTFEFFAVTALLYYLIAKATLGMAWLVARLFLKAPTP